MNPHHYIIVDGEQVPANQVGLSTRKTVHRGWIAPTWHEQRVNEYRNTRGHHDKVEATAEQLDRQAKKNRIAEAKLTNSK